MKSLLVLGAVLALLASGVALDREAFTASHYDLNLRLDPAQHRLGAHGTITLRNDSSQPQRIVALQISSSLNWRSIRLLSNPQSPESTLAVQFIRQPYTSDIDHTGELSEAIITLPRDVVPKESITLAISYEGVILLDAARLTRVGTPEAVARHSDWDQIGKDFTAVRGVGYVTWYPVALEAQNLSDGPAMFTALGKWKARHAVSKMELTIALLPNASEQPELLTNGKGCTAAENSVSGLTTLSGCVFEALGWANPLFVVGNFQQTVAPPLRIHVAAPDTSTAQELAKTSDRSAYLIKDWFGAPHENLEVIDLADPEAAPFEAGNWLLLSLAKTHPQMEQNLIVHQLTHASFPSPRLWIYEGAAHFAQALSQEKDGREAALAYLAPHRDAVAQAEKSGTGEPLAEATQEVFYRSKAALVWWMLRDMLGDAALKRALHEYSPDKDQDPTYLQRLLEAQSKRDLGWFFHDWVYTDAGLPDFHIESANARLANGTNFVVAITVANAGAAGAEVSVTIHTTAGDFTQRLEVRGKTKAVTRIATPTEPLEVIVNDGSVPESGASDHHLKIAKDAS